MAFTQSTFASIGAHSSDTPNLYSYKSTDGITAVSAADYFIDKKLQLEHGDFMLLMLSDFTGLVEVDETQSGVNTVADLQLQKSAYGELMVAEGSPEVQISAQYNTRTNTREFLLLSGTTDVSGGEYIASSGTSTFGIAAIFSDRQVISRAGQGTTGKFWARFSPGVVDCVQTAGMSTGLDGIAFGFADVLNGDFGIEYSRGGKVIIEELTVTAAATGSESATITINGTGFTVPLTAGTEAHNAHEIATSLNAQTTQFNFAQNGDTVICRSILAAPESGAFTFSSSTATATFNQIVDGVLPVREIIAQADWNVDVKADLDPLKYNNYTIRYNGSIQCFIQDSDTGQETLVHEIKLPNNRTLPMFSISAFRLAFVVINSGSTVDSFVFSSESSAFVDGLKVATKPSESQANAVAGIGTTQTNILTIRCRETFGDSVNLGRLVPALVSAATDSGKGAILEVCLDATFSGETNFSYINKDDSIAEIDTTLNTLTGGNCIATLTLGPSGTDKLDLDKFKQFVLPGRTLTISMAVTQTPLADMEASIIWETDL